MSRESEEPMATSQRGVAREGRSAPTPLWGYREILLLGAVLFVVQALAAGAAAALAGRFAGGGIEAGAELIEREPLVVVSLQMVVWTPALGYILFVVKRRYGLPLREGVAWRRLRRPAISYARTGVLLALGSALATVALSDPAEVSPLDKLFADRDSLWVLALFGVLLAPVLEEVVFRGFLFAAFERMHGGAVALAATTAVFALLHGSQYGWQWQRLAILAAVGCVFGAVRLQSGSSKASTIVHAAYNALLLLALLSWPSQLP